MRHRAAIYARVSSDRQAREATIESQLAALRERLRADGAVLVEECLDEGFSGVSLARPGLERLRDLAAEGTVDRVYIHSPDRLARKYAYQVLLLEEMERARVEVAFLDGTTGDASPEASLLQGVQGIIAEYERLRILERTRRGRLHRARAGQASVLGHAPYGYRYERRPGRGADFVVDEAEARVVREVFRLLVEDGLPLREIARRVEGTGATTRKGGRWTAATVARIAGNPAYKGEARFGKTTAEGATRARLRGNLGRPPRRREPPRRARPEAEHVVIPVPALVTPARFEAAREQLARNRALASRGAAPRRYLLQGLLRCGGCNRAYCGKGSISKGKLTMYYRCTGRQAQREAGLPACGVPSVRVDALDAFVWAAVARVLEDPGRVLDEWSQRNEADGSRAECRARRDEAARAVEAAERVTARLLDAYEAGVIDLDALTSRSARARARVDAARAELDAAEQELHRRVQLTALVSTVEAFAARVREGLATADFDSRQRLVRALVREVVIDGDAVRIEYQVPGTESPAPASDPAPGGDGGATGGSGAQNERLCTGRHGGKFRTKPRLRG